MYKLYIIHIDYTLWYLLLWY